MVALLLHGHAFAFINRSRATGEIVELVQIPSHAVSVEADDVTQEPSYWVQDPVRRQIDRSQIFHLQALNGEAPLMQVKEAIALSLVMEQHQSRLFANGPSRPACCGSRAGSASRNARAAAADFAPSGAGWPGR